MPSRQIRVRMQDRIHPLRQLGHIPVIWLRTSRAPLLVIRQLPPPREVFPNGHLHAISPTAPVASKPNTHSDLTWTPIGQNVLPVFLALSAAPSSSRDSTIGSAMRSRSTERCANGPASIAADSSLLRGLWRSTSVHRPSAAPAGLFRVEYHVPYHSC
jgi:hypothetical protein